jgi:hypothetical protein
MRAGKIVPGAVKAAREAPVIDLCGENVPREKDAALAVSRSVVAARVPGQNGAAAVRKGNGGKTAPGAVKAARIENLNRAGSRTENAALAKGLRDLPGRGQGIPAAARKASRLPKVAGRAHRAECPV